MMGSFRISNLEPSVGSARAAESPMDERLETFFGCLVFVVVPTVVLFGMLWLWWPME